VTTQTPTQTEAILAALKEGRELTPLDALREFGCFRLGARVYDLKKQGYDIATSMVDVGDGVRVAKYKLLAPPGQARLL
jgi:hypothetical protein